MTPPPRVVLVPWWLLWALLWRSMVGIGVTTLAALGAPWPWLTYPVIPVIGGLLTSSWMIRAIDWDRPS